MLEPLVSRSFSRQSQLCFFRRVSKRKIVRHFSFSAYAKRKSIADENTVPVLPLLNVIAQPLKGLVNFEKTALLCLQHAVPTTMPLLESVIQDLGCKPENVFFSSKFYSTCPWVVNHIRRTGIHVMKEKIPRKPGQYQEDMHETIKNMWEIFCTHLKNTSIEKIIVLDEGGHCLEGMPKFIPYYYKVAAIEQTRFGLYRKSFNTQLFPLIDVARSAAKRKLESRLIVESVLLRVEEVIENLHLNEETIFGVVGNGAIGSALVKYLLGRGYKVLVYDEKEYAFQGISNKNCYRVGNIQRVISDADIVFGCTGRDITKEIDIPSFVKEAVTLVSCSSQDIEFLTLLRGITASGHLVQKLSKNLSQIHYVTKENKEINILEGGFPINFDRTSKCDPPEDMSLTRGLLFSAIIQASLLARKPIDDGVTLNQEICYMLDPYLQHLVVNNWIVHQPKGRYSSEEIECFKDTQWILNNSLGEHKEENAIITALQAKNVQQTKNHGFTRVSSSA